MKLYIGFDDTDHYDSDYGTGKLVRWFEEKLPSKCKCMGVVRQQLYVCSDIAYTSHNSAACMIVNIPKIALLDQIIERAVVHLENYAVAGSDPGLCVATEQCPSPEKLIDFGRECTHSVQTQKEAMAACDKIHLSGHGGTNDGIIGAAAAVGLTLSGWSGRFIEFKELRGWPLKTAVKDLNKAGINTISIDRNARMPASDDIVNTHGWLRPRLIGTLPVLLVKPVEPALWETIDHKCQKKSPPKS